MASTASILNPNPSLTLTLTLTLSLTLTRTRTRTLTLTPTPTPTLSAGRHPRASAATQRASQSARKGDGSAVDVYCRNTFPIEVRYRLGSCVSSRARREIKRTTHFLSAHSPAERWWRSEAGWVGSWVGSCFLASFRLHVDTYDRSDNIYQNASCRLSYFSLGLFRVKAKV